ncbi:MAG TPA: glyoxalase [Syntrophomonas sp.]|jgi:catechol 2,3-dioxygenase-like lactoylglutathione lyase family enzyme|nr:glyoxalase [Syntrophomonas sp.]HCF70527.1 glyoxalase [Syntrophomonas sp.]
MRFVCSLIVVNDISISRNFYEKVLNQKIEYDFGENVLFEGGFAIHLKSHFAELIKVSPADIIPRSNNSELYFEEDDLDGLLEKLKRLDSVEYIHGIQEQPWGQRVIRFYDPDQHIVEVGESMASVAIRFLNQGLSIEETAQRTSLPEKYVRTVSATINPSKWEEQFC